MRKKKGTGSLGDSKSNGGAAEQQQDGVEKKKGGGADDGGGARGAAPTPPAAEGKPISYFKLFSSGDALDWLLVILGTVGALGHGTALPLFSLLFGDFTDAFGSYIPPCGPFAGLIQPPGAVEGFRRTISGVALKFIYLAAGACVAAALQQGCWSLTSTRQSNRLRRKYLSAVLRQDAAFFETQATTGGLLQGLNEDSLAVQAAISEKMGQFLQHTATFLAGFILAFTKGWDVTLVLVGCMPFLAAMGSVLAKLSSTSNTKSQTAYTEAGAIAQQAISQIRTVAAYGGEVAACEAYDKLLTEPQKIGRRMGLVTGLAIGGMQFTMFCSYAAALFYGAYRVANGAYSGGTVLSVIISSLIGSFSLGLAGPLLEQFSKGTSAGTRMFAVLRRAPAIDAQQGGVTPPDVQGAVELKGISFAYPARPDVRVLSNFSLSVPSGKTVALVGSSGSGKSTVVGLIERFYDPSEGVVTLDGRDIRALDIRWLRKQVGLVSQEPTLFQTTIKENIAIGKPGATDDEIEAAVAAANATRFIANLPLGLETQVGERGVQLSGGQKQRIAIARAILRNPRVLLLDEATSALDAESERVVQAALDRLVVGRTTIVVAHRLSTIRDADVIAVVKGGVVVEQGSHNTLLADPTGHYTTLVKLQMQAIAQEAAVEAELEEAIETGTPVTRASIDRVESRRRSIELARLSSSGGPSTGATSSHRRISIDPDAVIPPPTTAAAAAGAAGGAALGRPSAVAATASRGSVELTAVVVHAGSGSGGVSPVDAASVDKGAAGDAAAAGEAQTKAPKVPFSRLLALNRPEWPWGMLGCVASAVAGGIQPAFAFALVSLTVAFYKPPDQVQAEASFYSWIFFGIACGILVACTFQQWSFAIMGQALARRVRVALFGAILRQDISFFDKDENSSGRLATLLSTDAAYIRGAVGDVLGAAMQNAAVLVAGYAIAFAYNWRMALLVTGAAPFIALGGLLQVKYMLGATSATDKVYSQANQAVTEAVASIKVIHAYNLDDYVTSTYSKLLATIDKAARRTSAIGGISTGYAAFSMFAVYALITFFGGEELISCRSTFDAFFKAFMSVLFAAMGLSQIQMAFPDLAKAQAAVSRVFPLVDRVPLIDSKGSGGEEPDAIKGEIELKGVTFAYPSRPSVIVFSNFNLRIPAGKTVALVGESGSGKSTVVGLIERFYDPSEGVVTLDGRDIRSLDIRWLRKQIGLVSQEPLLFSGTIADNIRYGKPDASEYEINAAVAAANAADFVGALPEGLNTKVGERGVQLSGGQKQRIAIARALVRNPRVLLLDEATSALDAASEAAVQAALDRAAQGRTTIVVAHRLSTIRDADSIAVVHRGVILEQGTHEELMALPSGGYARLMAAQMRTQGGSGGGVQAS